MKRVLSFLLLFLLVGSSSFAQNFEISAFDGESLDIAYPPSFDGAYLFVESCSNLTDSAWETIDYSQVSLASGDEMMNFSMLNPEGDDVGPSLNSIWSGPQDAVRKFFRVSALSFVDSDGDGVDNVTEHR
jgi:hypothetical protein